MYIICLTTTWQGSKTDSLTDEESETQKVKALARGLTATRAESGSPSGWAESRPGALHHTPLSAQITALKPVLVPSHKGLAGWILTWLLDKIFLIDHHILFSLFNYSSLGIGNLFFSYLHIFMSLL